MYLQGINKLGKSLYGFLRIILVIVLIVGFLAIVCAAIMGLFYGIIYLASLAWHAAQ